jgi:hypothetical protein
MSEPEPIAFLYSILVHCNSFLTQLVLNLALVIFSTSRVEKVYNILNDLIYEYGFKSYSSYNIIQYNHTRRIMSFPQDALLYCTD